MAMNVGLFQKLTAYVNDNWNEFAALRVAADKGLELFGAKAVEFQTEVVQNYSSLNKGIKRVADGGTYPSIVGAQGDGITFVQAHYAGRVDVTKDLRLFNRYEAEVPMLVQTAVDACFDNLDQNYADVLLNGWASSYVNVYGDTVSNVGPDSKVLFASNHSTSANAGYSFDNRVTDGVNVDPRLSRDAIVTTKARALKYVDPGSIKRPIKLDTIVCSPDLEDLAYRIVKTDGIAGTPNRDTNAYLGGMNILSWERLGSTGQGADTSSYWFMVDSTRIKQGLRSYFRQQPKIGPEREFGPDETWTYLVDYYNATGFSTPNFIFGSRGLN